MSEFNENMPPASHPAPSPIVGEREEPNKCVCPDYAGEHAGCDFPACDRYANKKIIHVDSALTNTAEELQGYKECAEDNKRLVREIDVIINGEDGAAKQASLCDLVGQIKELVAARAQLATARTLILNIKIGNIYQEPADECGKWLINNPEVKA